jgi:23S rRNA-/tRNA-specific pseudouridylate synthase
VPKKSKQLEAIGFPPPLLGERPLRLEVLAATDDWLALEKPVQVGTRAHPWDSAPDLDTGLNRQLEAGKPELQRTGASLFGSAYYLDPEMTGVALFAKNRTTLADLRNRFGSGECRFIFRFVAGCGDAAAAEFTADAPLLPHRVKAKMVPSTAKGKKSSTLFRKLDESNKGWTLWEAEVGFFRPHQVRAHAATHGIPVLGDAIYEGPPAPTVRELEPRARRSDLDASVFAGLPIHLVRVEFPAGGADLRVESELPKPFMLLLRRLGLDLDSIG